jgi:hypothetical protein
MNCLEILRIVSHGIKRRRYCCIVWRKSAIIRAIKCCYVNVSIFYGILKIETLKIAFYASKTCDDFLFDFFILCSSFFSKKK